LSFDNETSQKDHKSRYWKK